MGGGGGGDTTTVQKADPWSGQQPYLSYGFQQARQLYDSGGPDYYPGATYVPFSPQSELALQLTQARALAGSPITQGAQTEAVNTLSGSYLPDTSRLSPQLNQLMAGQGVAGNALSSTASGAYLNANPYLDATYDRAVESVTRNFRDAVMPSINSTFSAAGRTGSGLQLAAVDDAARNLSENLSGMATSLYGQNYAQERQNQLAAAGQLGQQQLAAAGTLGGMLNNERGRQIQTMLLSPQLADADYNDFQRLAGVGQAIEGQAGNMLADTMNRYNFYQQRPEDNLARYISAIQGNYGHATTSEVEGAKPNRAVGAVGGAATGAYLGSQIMPGWGTAIGAIGGGLLGMFA